MNWVRSIAAIALACFMACSAQTDRATRSEGRLQQSTQMPIVDRQVRIAPGRCRIVGTLVAIDSVLEKGGPCSKAPCRGFVRVDSVLGYGAAFGNPVAVSERVDVRFAFTLAPMSKELFPNMTEQLPGLQIGTRFQADLESQNEFGNGERRVSYLVQEYKKLN
jgi:hypothetical protein